MNPRNEAGFAWLHAVLPGTCGCPKRRPQGQVNNIAVLLERDKGRLVSKRCCLELGNPAVRPTGRVGIAYYAVSCCQSGGGHVCDLLALAVAAALVRFFG
ncbi:hypothetical protein CHU95_20130 [Niveispirillum lacus]|uniref:Uncharacterized protein n=1 Tax=Niveispirillum lacus TaxID=1981099 RepID=A0A255YQG2_9PROT|nr:hypothetical protein CHU95_20130 [Niveispirillum lacus]